MKIKIEMELSEFEEFMCYRINASLFLNKEKELRNELGGELESLAGCALDAIEETSETQPKFPPVYVIKDQTAAAVLVAKAAEVFS